MKRSVLTLGVILLATSMGTPCLRAWSEAQAEAQAEAPDAAQAEAPDAAPDVAQTEAQTEAQPTTQDQHAQALALVEQLGHERFSAREKATEDLIALGVGALEALKSGQRNTDREIRYRSSRILTIVQELDFQRRLQAFASDHGNQKEHYLPGWDRFRKLVGGDPASRSLFVAMQEKEAELMQAIEKGDRETAELLTNRCAEIQHAMRFVRQQLELGSVTALLFAAAQPDVSVTQRSSSTLFSFCYQTSFQTEIAAGTHKERLRTILGAWIERSQDALAYQGLALSMRYELKQGLIPAQGALKANNNPIHIRQYAVLTIAKLGDKSHLPVLEPLLADKTRCSMQRINNVQYETQLRDVALASILHLSKKDLKDFGFSRVQPNTQIVFNTSTLGFRDEEHRAVAIKKWNELRAEKSGIVVHDSFESENVRGYALKLCITVYRESITWRAQSEQPIDVPLNASPSECQSL